MTRFLFNLVTTHVLHLWSLLLAHLPAPLWKSPIAPLGMLHLVYGINSPLISASLVRHSLLLFLLSHMAVHHLYHLQYHRLHHLLLAQNFILNSRLGFSANPFLHRPFPFLPDTDSRTMLNGCTGKCVRLSRPLVGFRTQFKSLHFHLISFHCLSVCLFVCPAV